MVEHASGGHTPAPADDPDRIRVLLSPAARILDVALVARLNGLEVELGTMPAKITLEPGKNPLLAEPAHFERDLAAALRAAADDLEAEGATDG